MYNKIKEKFIASPTNPQYVFSHHDLARIAKGVFIYSPKSRLRAKKSGHRFPKGDLTVIQSMPDLQIKNSMTAGLPDPRLVFKGFFQTACLARAISWLAFIVAIFMVHENDEN